MADVKPVKRTPAKKTAVVEPRNEKKDAKSLLEAVLKAVSEARDAGIDIKGVYSLRNDDGTVDNGSLK